MSRITVTCLPANQALLTALLNQYATVLNSLGRYVATVAGSTLDLQPLIAPVHFLRVSPSASDGAVADFCTFAGENPPLQMVDEFAPHAGPDFGTPGQAFKDALAANLADPNRTFPGKLQILQSAIAQIYRDSLSDVFENVILPWFFGVYPNGRVMAATQTAESGRYEFILRQLTALARYGFEALRTDAARRKPYMDLLQPLEARIENIAKLAVQYNAPYVDGFCLRGIFSVFVFIPDDSVHRRSFDTPSIFDVLAPFSSVGASADLFEQDGHHDSVRAIHPRRNSTEIEEWVRYWLLRTDATLDRLYNLCRVDDAAGNIDLDNYLRGILQFERIFFEITWSCSMLDQFLRKVVAYALMDKITAFMSDTWCNPATNARSRGTDKFVKVMTAAFMVTRLPQLYQNPVLQAHATHWLQTVHSNVLAKQREHTFPSNLIQGGQVDWAARAAVLAPCATLPGSGAAIDEEVYVGQLVRAVRNTHHGFADLYDTPFAVLGSSSGAISDELPTILPFLAFAMLDDPDAALTHSW
jgi:hypothetical protein